MNNITASKKIHSVEDARNLAKKRMPRLMFDFVDGASGDERLCEINSTAVLLISQSLSSPEAPSTKSNINLGILFFAKFLASSTL